MIEDRRAARLPHETVRKWRRWKARSNQIFVMERELARYPHLRDELERQKRMRDAHRPPTGFASWSELEARLRASGQF